MQDEGIGGQLEPEMGGAAAPAQPQQPRTYADRIAMGEPDTSCLVYCLLGCSHPHLLECFALPKEVFSKMACIASRDSLVGPIRVV